MRVKSGVNNDLVGLYSPSGSALDIFSSFKHLFPTNTTTKYPRIEPYNLSGSDYAWGVFTAPNTPRYRSIDIYDTLNDIPTCPDGITWVNTTGNTGAVVTVVGKSEGQVHREFVASVLS